MKNNRNAQIVGNNSKSYNDKHPNNPVSLRPIYDACRTRPELSFLFRALANRSRPTIAKEIAAYS